MNIQEIIVKLSNSCTLHGGQTKLAKMLGVSTTAVNKWLQNGKIPTKRTQEVEKLLGIEITEIKVEKKKKKREKIRFTEIEIQLILNFYKIEEKRGWQTKLSEYLKCSSAAISQWRKKEECTLTFLPKELIDLLKV